MTDDVSAPRNAVDNEFDKKASRYVPDFLVALELADGARVSLILEIKGQETEQDRAKWSAARQWVRAVNNHGGFGAWDYRICKQPAALLRDLERWRTEWQAAPLRASARPQALP